MRPKMCIGPLLLLIAMALLPPAMQADDPKRNVILIGEGQLSISIPAGYSVMTHDDGAVVIRVDHKDSHPNAQIKVTHGPLDGPAIGALRESAQEADLIVTETGKRPYVLEEIELGDDEGGGIIGYAYTIACGNYIVLVIVSCAEEQHESDAFVLFREDIEKAIFSIDVLTNPSAEAQATGWSLSDLSDEEFERLAWRAVIVISVVSIVALLIIARFCGYKPSYTDPETDCAIRFAVREVRNADEMLILCGVREVGHDTDTENQGLVLDLKQEAFSIIHEAMELHAGDQRLNSDSLVVIGVPVGMDQVVSLVDLHEDGNREVVAELSGVIFIEVAGPMADLERRKEADSAITFYERISTS